MCFVHICGQLAALPAVAGDELSLCGSTKQEGEQAQRRGQVPAGGLPSHSWHIQVIFSSVNMLSGKASGAAKAAGKSLSFSFTYEQTQPNL